MFSGLGADGVMSVFGGTGGDAARPRMNSRRKNVRVHAW